MDWLTIYNGILLRGGLYLIIFWPTVGYYIYKDSKSRGRKYPKILGLVYGFFGIAGLFVYLARKRRAQQI